MKYDKLLKRPIIFIGSGRTGTTILSDIVFRHADLAFPSNYQEFFPSATSVNCVRNVFDNSLWKCFGKRTYSRNVLNLNNYAFRPTEGYRMWNQITGASIDFSDDFLLNVKAKNSAQIRDYFGKMVKLQGRKRLAFKITGPSRMEYLLSIFPDAIFVDSKRRLVPTVSSFLKQSFWQDNGAINLKWRGPYTDEETQWIQDHKDAPHLVTAFQLGKIQYYTEAEKEQFKPQYTKVHYESLLKNPEDVLKHLLDFLDLSSDRYCIEFLKTIRRGNGSKPDTAYFSEVEIDALHQAYNSAILNSGQ